MKRYAFFDLDYTLTKKDTGMQFLLFNLKRKPSIILRILAGAILIPLWKMHLIKLQKLKQFFFGFIKNSTEDQIEILSQKFIESIWDTIIKPEGIDTLKQHIQDGIIPVLVSASPHFYVRFFAKKMGIKYFAGTRYETQKNKYTGKIEGIDCRGSEKIPRVAELIDLSSYIKEESFAYSDSNADIPLLNLAGNAYKTAKKKWILTPFR